MKKKLFSAIALLLTLIFTLTACTQPAAPAPEAETPEEPSAPVEVALEYPVRPIQNVIPFGAGGGTDVWNRALMDAMSGPLGQTIVSSNMTGGSAGSIGVEYAWKSPHDGYTIVGTSETPLTIPVQTGFDKTAKDWEFFIAAGSPGILAVNAKSKYKTLDEVLTALENEPESVSIAGTQGGLWFALAKLFDSYGDVPFKWVAYGGSGPAIKGAVSNETDCVVASAGEMKEFIKSGDLIPLAVMDKVAWDFPEYGSIPAIIDTVPELETYLPLQQFLGFMMPKDTDPEILAILQDAFAQAMESESINTFADEQLAVIFNLTGEEANKMALGLESKLSWILSDMGQTKFSPDEFEIPKP